MTGIGDRIAFIDRVIAVDHGREADLALLIAREVSVLASSRAQVAGPAGQVDPRI
jgi:hypothetical protein